MRPLSFGGSWIRAPAAGAVPDRSDLCGDRRVGDMRGRRRGSGRRLSEHHWATSDVGLELSNAVKTTTAAMRKTRERVGGAQVSACPRTRPRLETLTNHAPDSSRDCWRCMHCVGRGAGALRPRSTGIRRDWLGARHCRSRYLGRRRLDHRPCRPGGLVTPGRTWRPDLSGSRRDPAYHKIGPMGGSLVVRCSSLQTCRGPTRLSLGMMVKMSVGKMSVIR